MREALKHAVNERRRVLIRTERREAGYCGACGTSYDQPRSDCETCHRRERARRAASTN